MTKAIKAVASDDRRFADAAVKYKHLINPTKDERTIAMKEKFLRFDAGHWILFKQEQSCPRYLGRFDNVMSAVFCALK